MYKIFKFYIYIIKKSTEIEDLDNLRMKRKQNIIYTLKIIGQGNYFGEVEIVKEAETREDRAVCFSQEAELYIIEQQVKKKKST